MGVIPNPKMAFIFPISCMGMFKNNEAVHFMASYAHICLDFKDQT